MADKKFSDIRRQYPEYGDLDDPSLADALHKRFYADLGRDEFFKKVGVEPPAAQQQVRRDAPQMPAAPTPGVNPLLEAMTGQPEPKPAPAPQPPATMVDTTDDARASRGFGRSSYLDGLVPAPAALGRGLDKARRTVGVDAGTPQERAQEIRETPLSPAAQKAQQRLESGDFQVMDWRDVKGLKGAVQYVGENLATSLPQMGSAVVSGALAPVSQIAILGAEANEELKEQAPDLPENRRMELATGAGTLMWGFETIGLGAVLRGVTPGKIGQGAVLGQLQRFLQRRGVPAAAARVIEAGMAEGSTEAVQEGIIMAATALGGGEYDSDEVRKRLTDAFIAGGSVGGTLRAGGEIATRGRADEVPEEIPTTSPAQPNAGVVPLDAAAANARVPQEDRAPEAPRAAPDQPQTDDEWETMPEIDTSSGEPVETGRQVRVSRSTGAVEVVEDQESAGAPPAAGPGGTVDASMGSGSRPAETEQAPRTPGEGGSDPIPVGDLSAGQEVDVSLSGGPTIQGRITRMTSDGPVLVEDDGTETVIPVEDIEDAETKIWMRGGGPKIESETAAPKERSSPNRTYLDHETTLAIETDPETFQYKGGGDIEGVTDRLRGVSEFDPIRAGQIIVYEAVDGRLIVADGHQRTGLARRAAEVGQKDVGGMAAAIYRQSEGYSPAEVMGIAALKNIGEGTGTALDAARILRNRSETVEELGLPPRSALVRDAEGLRRLSDDAFGMVTNEVASERDGAVVGRVVEDSALHADILRLLGRLKPQNVAQAEMIARDAASDATTSTQEDLFGSEQVAQSLYLERAKVLDSAVKELRKDRATFARLGAEADKIEGAGNQLDKGANQRRADDDAKVLEYLQRQANTKGPISDALSTAARSIKEGRPLAEAARRFVQDTKRSLQEPGAGGGEVGEGGRGDKGQRQADTDSERREEGVDRGVPQSTPQTGQTPEGEQAVIPGAERDQKRSDDARKADQRAEIEARQQQSKMRREGGNSGGEGPLFGRDRDLFDADQEPVKTEKPDTKALRRAMSDRIKKYVSTSGEWFGGSRDFSDSAAGDQLLADIDAADTVAERQKIADDFVLAEGREAGVEIMVALDEDGQVLSVAVGERSGVNPPRYVYKMAYLGMVGYVTHNHPSNRGFSPQDMAIISNGFRHISAIGHDGAVSNANAGPIYNDRYAQDDQRGYAAHYEKFNAVDQIIIRKIQQMIDGDEVKVEAADRAHAHITNLILDRHGIIDFKGNSYDIATREGFDVDAILKDTDAAVSAQLRRGGFVVAPVRDRRRDQQDGRGGEEAGRPASGRPGSSKRSSQDQEGGDGNRRVSAPEVDAFDKANYIRAKETEQRFKDDQNGMDRATAAVIMPRLRAELDRLDLKRVELGLDTPGATRQGAMVSRGNRIEILIGQALDPVATLYHEAIHAMKAMNLFTPQEWKALERAALRGWIEKHDIAKRYPDLTPSEQIEEAIAEEFAERAANRQAPQGSALIRAFNKIGRLLKAIRNAVTGAGFQTAEDVFGRALAGEIGARDAGNTGIVAEIQKAKEQRFKFSSGTGDDADGAFSAAALAKHKALSIQYGGLGVPTQQTFPPAFAAPVRKKLDWLQETFQDRFIMFRAAEAAIEQQTGQTLPESMSFGMKETLFRGRTASRLERLMREEIRPLTEAIAKSGITLDDLGMFLIAKHAPERNAVMAKRDPKRFGKGGGSGMTDEHAAEVLRDIKERGLEKQAEKMADLVRIVLRRDLLARRAAGLISESEYQAFTSMYENYVPLRGFAEREEGGQLGTGSGFDVRGKESRNALGRSTLSDNPVVQAIAMRQAGIVRAEKNRVTRALMRLVQRYPNPDIWEPMGKLPMRRMLDPDTGMVKEVVDFGAVREDEVLAVKIDGDTKYLRIKDPLMAEAVKNLDLRSQTILAKTLNVISRFTRSFSRLQTGANPDFTFPNGMADFLEGVWTAYNVRDTKRMMRAYAKNYPLALIQGIRSEFGDSAIGRALTGKNKDRLERLLGTEISEPELKKFAAYQAEWEAAGGKINFMAFRDLDEITRDINREIEKSGRKRWQIKPFETIENMLAVIEKVNQPVESAGRLAMYVAARENGLSKEKAAALALDASGNYFRNGRATRGLAALYAFFNPAVQGMEKFIRFSKRPRNWAVLGGVMTTGYVMTLLMIHAYEDEEDPESRSLYLDIPEWKRASSIVIPTGIVEEKVTVVGDDGKPIERSVKRLDHISIRIPHNLRPLLVLGAKAAELQSKQTEPEDAMHEVSRSVLMSTNPFGAETPMNMVAPTILDPFVDLAMNRKFGGSPIHPDEMPWNEGVPKSSQYWERSTNPMFSSTAQALNWASGGNRFKSGFADVYPDDIEHLYEYMTGGLGRFISRGVETAMNAAQDIETDPNRKPIVRSFKGRTNEYAEGDRYYRSRSEEYGKANLLRAAKKALDRDPGDEEAADAMARLMRETNVSFNGSKFSWTASTVNIFKAADKELKVFREDIVGIVNDKSLARPQRMKQIREKRLQIEQVQIRARKDYVDLMTQISAASGGP
ncbi:LPD38 domain-containing protein [Pseudooceanicola atlanticus]|uniref:LPD38 domain-containing protein n=1 Tax=Pseudooceanicola atlanticus TaxID=1461694 RepID=UPI002354E197|nr:LPD38 domain-containing protein [Pseudooceanicola atlanticus]